MGRTDRHRPGSRLQDRHRADRETRRGKPDLADGEDARGGRPVPDYVQQRLIPELARLPGFLSFTGGGVGDWQFTLTMWESMEALAQLQSLASHREAVKWFFKPGAEGIGSKALTGVWGVERLNTLWVRCTGCEHMVDADAPGALCTTCGAALPEHSPYW